jgi:hypothetical protein
MALWWTIHTLNALEPVSERSHYSTNISPIIAPMKLSIVFIFKFTLAFHYSIVNTLTHFVYTFKRRAIQRGVQFLKKTQRSDGSW